MTDSGVDGVVVIDGELELDSGRANQEFDDVEDFLLDLKK
jgi:hypothetical protein